jgi:FkbM family methyltransferase
LQPSRAVDGDVACVTSAAPAQGPISSGFNTRFLRDDRSEQIFAYHLKRMGIGRVLDIGSNSGQFAKKLRRFGYDGALYCVEPQAGAYRQLVTNASADLKWFPLARQGAGATPVFMELNISANGYSSSLREVHENHVRAESQTRAVGTEHVFVNSSGRLLRSELMQSIEALKIDVQGYEDAVLDGYLPLIGNVRLLLVEMSLVECYKGGPDLFSLDRRLVGELGFSRVSLEPAYYDDTLGVVQQYDGIYFRPDRPAATIAKPRPIEIAAVVTSIGGKLERRLPDGGDLGPLWLQMCMRSWQSIGAPVVSVSERAPPEGIHWAKTDSRPNLVQMLAAVQMPPASHLLMTNADIVFTDALRDVLPTLDPDAVYYGSRTDVERVTGESTGLVAKGLYDLGFDYFLLPDSFIRVLLDKQLMPLEFLIGEPWWDYLLPVLALASGFALKKLASSTPLALHYAHPARYSPDIWARNRDMFIRVAAALQADPNCHAPGLLNEFLAHPQQIAHQICRELP